MCALKNFAPLTKIIDMKKIVFILAFVALLAGCKKDEPAEPVEPCKSENWGYAKSINSKSDPYLIYIDNKYQQVCPAGGTSTINEIPAGVYVWKAVQQSGYLLYPTEYTASLTVYSCQETKVAFP